MSKIFISYRREDSGGYAGRLYDRLSQHFGRDQVFMDIDHIEPGEDFVELIGQQVGTCKILIALIGRSWVNAADKAGARRLDDPEDFVRVEIASALTSNVRVMPVLVGGANMPSAQQLPEQLGMLVRRNAAELSDLRFHQDVDRLIESIEKAIVSPSPNMPPIPSEPVRPTEENRSLIETEQQSELQEQKKPGREARGRLASGPLQKFKWPLTAIGMLLLLAAVGLWYWDAYYRPHSEYYANAIMRWGLPEGIGHLTATQMQHRNSVLKFVRRGRKGAIQEVRIVNSRGQYAPVFASSGFLLLDRLMPLAGNTRVGGLSLPSGLVARRVVFEQSHDGRVLAQRAYNSSNRLLYALQYVDADIARFGDGPFAEAIRESGITHIKFVRANTGAESGLDKEILFLDGSGKPKPDSAGSYGSRFTFDSRGSIVQELNLDEKGNPAPDHLGIAKVVNAYDETWGNMIRLKNLSRDNQPVIGSTGIAELAMSYDVYGNLQQVAFFGKEGRLVTQRTVGAAIRTIAYDDHGNIVENTFRDANQKLVTGALGFAKQKVQWDKQGRSWETFFGPDDKPILNNGRTVMLRATWDERGNPVSFEHFDEHNRPTLNENGCAKSTFVHDHRGNVTEQACFDEMDRPVRNTSGWAKVKITSDDRGNAIEMHYFGSEGQPELYGETFVKVVSKYNEQGKKTEEAYLDVANRPVKNKSRYAKINFEYNTQGKLTQLAFFDENGQPTPRKGGYAKIVRVYDGRGNMAEEILFDPQGNPTTHEEEGYSKSKFKYDDRGHRTERAYFDKNDRLTLHTDGYARIRYKYNDKGRMIEQVFVGLDDSAIAPKQHGYAKRRWTFDERGNISQLAYFGTNDQLVRNPLGYATIRYLYDSLGRETKREFFDVNGAPVLTRVAINKLEPDSKGLRVKLEAGDLLLGYDGEDVADTRKFGDLELGKGERKRELRIERDGKVLSVDVDPGRLTGVETVDKVPPQRKETGA